MAEGSVGTVNAGPIAEFPTNSSTIVRFGRTPVILIRTGDGDFRAFAATCTHLDCIVQFRPDLQRIWCACHGGQFDLTGRNVAGPPPKPLPEFVVNEVDGEIVISQPDLPG